MKSAKKNKITGKVIVYIVLAVGAVTMIFPFLWMLLTSFKTNSEALQVPPTFLPANWLTDGYVDALESLPFGRLFLNTALMIILRVICAVVFCSMAGYAFAKLNFKGKNIWFTLIIVQMMLPGQIFIIPQYQMLAKMGMLNTIFALVFPGLVSAFGVFFLR